MISLLLYLPKTIETKSNYERCSKNQLLYTLGSKKHWQHCVGVRLWVKVLVFFHRWPSNVLFKEFVTISEEMCF